MEDIVKDFKQTLGSSLSERSYRSVHVLLVYWEDNDFQNLDQEVHKLRCVFEKSFNFTVASFPIPVSRGQQMLGLEMAKFICDYSDRLNTLIVIYYAGHGEFAEGEARWFASEKDGSPTLSWTACQHSLFGALGDVLLILDCCEAAIFSKGKKWQGRFEALAACVKGVKTIGPSERSFTSILVRLLERHNSGITVHEISQRLRQHNAITRKRSEPRIRDDPDSDSETPYWANLVLGSDTNIRLEPWKQPPGPQFMRKPSSYVVFRASLTEDPIGTELADWFKTAAPKAVTAVDLEAVVLHARSLQRNQEASVFPSDSLFGKFPPECQAEICQKIQGLDTVMANAITTAKNPGFRGNDEAISNAYSSIEDAVTAVTRAVETPVLLKFDKDALDDTLLDRHALAAGISGNLTLRREVVGTVPVTKGPEISRDDIVLEPGESRFRTGFIESRPILMEVLEYVPDPDTKEPYPETVNQVQKMAGLLCHPKRSNFHILPCVGYFHDRLNDKFGLVFEPPVYQQAAEPHSLVATEPQELLDLYSPKNKYVALGDRIRLAHALAVALENFHRVGWVHKDFRSANISFLSPNQPAASWGPVVSPDTIEPSIDFSTPWLFGFEYARAGDAGTAMTADYNQENNLYRHPDRWGKPRTRFTKAHDVYSLGIVLCEIACWQSIASIVQLKPRQKLSPQRTLDIVKSLCRKKLPHIAGTVFADTVLACLNFEECTQGKSEFDAQLKFQQKILDKLKGLVGVV